MSSMQGNPHFHEADRSEIDEVPFVIAQAILALAFEQRTANLIALYSMDESCCQGMVDGADMTSENWVDVTKQIKERLGLR